MRIAIQGIGVVGGFGTGVASFRQALNSGKTILSSVPLANCGTPLELPALLADTEQLKDFVPLRALRRIDHFSKLGLLGAHLAMADAGILAEEGQERLGVIIATGYGATGSTFAFQDSFISDGDICASPTYFANSVHNSAAANISMLLGATGPSTTVSQFHLSVPAALQTAWQWLTEGRVDRVLFGAIDELSELIGYSWCRQRGMVLSTAMTPLLTGIESAIPGEGAAFLLLSRREEKQESYCLLKRVAMGRHLQSCTPDSPEAVLVLGADGRKELGTRYAALAAGSRLTCHTPLYGSMPAAPAFDLAAAALMLRGSTVFPIGGSDGCDFPARVVHGAEPLDSDQVSCLALGEDDGYGLVTLKGCCEQ